MEEVVIEKKVVSSHNLSQEQSEFLILHSCLNRRLEMFYPLSILYWIIFIAVKISSYTIIFVKT